MPGRISKIGAVGVLGFGLAVFGWSGCGIDSTEPETPEPVVVVSTMIGTLSRVNSSSDFSDTLTFWVDAAKMDATDRLRFGGVIDETAEPADPDGFVFQLAPDAGTSLFTPGRNLAVELLAAGGGVVATVFCEGPAADLEILFPVSAGEASVTGIDVRWRSDGLGPATIRLLSEVDDTVWEITTSDDGEYDIGAATLADFPKGFCRLEISAESETSLASVELGNGTMTYLMSSTVTFLLRS
jgi:hypothetical protein